MGNERNKRMKMTNRTKLLSLALCLVLTWTAALISGCNDNPEIPESGTGAATATTTPADSSPVTTAAEAADVKKLGEGNTVFVFTVTDKDGKETVFEISTDKAVVGEALQELGLIEGDEGAYGLYVKKVNGITADYDTDGTYWAFYVNGEYAMTGVDVTDIKAGDTYSFKIAK